MAIVFELWAETRNADSRQRFVEHFTNHTFTLLSGRTIRCEIHRTPDSPLAVLVYPDGLSRYGIGSLNDALETTETGLRLCKHLKTAPDFCFAHVAWEAENISMAELKDYVEVSQDGRHSVFLPCVVDEKLYRELGSPGLFKMFREGYWWYPYPGESYRPLYSSDQNELNDLCRQLFPAEYFKY